MEAKNRYQNGKQMLLSLENIRNVSNALEGIALVLQEKQMTALCASAVPPVRHYLVLVLDIRISSVPCCHCISLLAFGAFAM